MILQPGDIVYDYSMARPTDADFARVPGLKGVCRYLSPLNADGSYYGPAAAKMITIDEYRWHLSQGRVVIKNYEWYEGRMGEGAPAGKQDAYWAATLAWRLDQAVGVTPGGISKYIIFSDDTGGTPYSAVKAYLLASYQQMQGMPGGYLPTYYGRESIITQLVNDPDITWDIGYLIWQTGAWSGCQHGGTAPLFQAICWPERIDEQIGGCDVNIVKKAIGSDDDMSQADVDNINVHIQAAVQDTIDGVWTHTLVAADKSTPVGSGQQALSDARQISRRVEIAVQAVAGAVQTLLKNDVTEQQKLDALAALEQAQTQAEAGAATQLLSAVQAIQAGQVSDEQVQALVSALSSALPTPIAQQVVDQLQVEVSHKPPATQ